MDNDKIAQLVDKSVLASTSDGDLKCFNLAALKGNLENEIFSELMIVLGELIVRPPQDQEETLANLRKCFLGIQFLGVDKSNSIISKIVFEDKTYVLDTDFALKLIVKDNPSSNIYRMIIKTLINHGAKVIIPRQILEEMGTHAKYAHRAFYYFFHLKNGVDDNLLLEMIENIFVKGFFSSAKIQVNIENFKIYLSNYYDPANASDFFAEYIHDEISNKIEFPDFSTEFSYETDFPHFDNAKKRSLELTEKTTKSEKRSEEENKLIADNDVLLYANLYIKNQKRSESVSIITNATRMLKVAQELGVYDTFYIKPATLICYMESNLSIDISYKDIMQSLKNPFLLYAVKENWNEVKRLIELGGDFRGKELTRLKRDLKNITQKCLYSDLKTEKANTNEVSKNEMEFVSILKHHNFKFSGELSDKIDKIENLESENAKLQKELNQYKEKEVKRNKYLKKQKGKMNT